MRELNECTAEVFRRSEKRIRERRRKRARVLAVCVPVCLVVAVWSAAVFPPMILAEENSNHVGFPGMADKAEGSLVRPYTAVEIQGGLFPEEHDGKVTDAAAAAEMFRAVDSLFADADNSGWDFSGNVPSDENTADRVQTESTDIWRGYTITFMAEDGSQAVYRLRENTLVKVSTGETVFLSDAQAAGLLAVLGLSE